MFVIFMCLRAIQIIGFSSSEILGTSGYDYCHIDDIDELIECHKLCK